MSVRHSRARSGVAVATLALLASVLPLAAMSANAAPADQRLASANPEDWTPRVLDKSVLAVVQIGTKVIVGGDFTTIQRPGANTPQISRPYLFAFDASSGAIDDSFVPVLNGRVQALLPHPDGDKVWAAGAFSSVNGQNVSRLVLLNLNTGQRVSSFTSPSINAVVNDVRRAGDRLYIGGQFTTVGGQPRAALASLDATSGALTSHLVTAVSGTNSGGTTSVRAMDVTPTGDKLVAIGNFTQVDGQTRNQIAVWDTGATTASLSSWRTDLYGNFCNSVFNTYMRDVDLAPDGSFFVVVTTGSYRAGRLCDTAARWETQRTGSGQAPSWVDYSGGDTLTSVEVTGPIAYVGGHQRWMNNPFAGDKAGSGAVPREGLVALDTRNGLPFSWDPGRQRGVGVFDMSTSATHLWAGSDTNYWANEYRPRVAGFPFSGGVPLPPDRVGTLPGDVLLVGRPGSSANEVRRVAFDGATVGQTTTSTGPESWSAARGAFLVDDRLFTGWSDNRFTVRTYNGTSWGAPKSVPLYEYTDSSSTAGYLNNFVRDVAKLTGIVYEPKDSRIYYTMSGSSSLFWRHFTPESAIVGAERFTVANASALSPANVRGMFLDGERLYFSDQNGVLKRIAFTRGSVGTSATTVNTQIDWRSGGMAVLTTAGTPLPNQSPTAGFTVSCSGLSCALDASSSVDPDGSITAYQWSLGDGAQATGRTVSHQYATAGTYDVTLTVTDDRAATDSLTKKVSVSTQSSTVAFRAANSVGGAASARPSVQVPASTVTGDTLLLLVSNGSARTPAPPSGWTLLDRRQDDELRTDVFWRTAVVTDAGSAVQVPLLNDAGDAQSAANTLTLAAYSGTAPPTSYEAAVETRAALVTDHRTPDVNVATPDSWVVSYWADRTSNTASTTATTSWQPPAGEAVRAQAFNTASGGRVTSLLTDGVAGVTGVRAGKTAVANGQTRKATMWSIVLSPGS